MGLLSRAAGTAEGGPERPAERRLRPRERGKAAPAGWSAWPGVSCEGRWAWSARTEEARGRSSRRFAEREIGTPSPPRLRSNPGVAGRQEQFGIQTIREGRSDAEEGVL